MKTVSVTLELPEIEGYEYTGEWREPKEGDYYLTEDNQSCEFSGDISYKVHILKKKRWQPDIGDKYWFVDTIGQTQITFFHGNAFDDKTFEFGNCFDSEKKATQAAEELKKAMLHLHKGEK